MSRKWEYNGVELEVDTQDAFFVEKYETAFEKMAENEKKIQKIGKVSAVLKGYCQLFFDLFDDIYGPGTSDKLFNGKINSGMTDECYERFLDAVKEDKRISEQKRITYLSKYVPAQNRQQNRQQCRNANKHKNKRNTH